MKPHECAVSKVCSECGIEKPLIEFYASQQGRKCKECQRRRAKRLYAENPAKKLAKCAEYRGKNQKRIKRYLAGWYEKNRDHVLKRCKEYNARPDVKERERMRQSALYAANKALIQERRRKFYSDPEAKARLLELYRKRYRKNKLAFYIKSAKRRAAKVSATPRWASLQAISQVYKEAKRVTEATGVKHVVDHIVPLQGETVCGLHVENNLQVLPEVENLKKWNKHG